MIYVLVSLAGLVALTHWRASAHEAAAEAAHPPAGEIVTVDGVPVHYKIIGSGPDVVLIHGANGNLNEFTMGFAQMLAEDYRVIMFDRPGLGWTGRLPAKAGAWNAREETPQEQARLLAGAADMLGVENPIVLGHSFGGIVALAWGLERNDETAALVLVASVSKPWPGELGPTYTVGGTTLGGALLIPLATAFLPESYVEQSVGEVFAPQPAPDGYAKHLGIGLSLRRESIRANAQQVNALRPHVVEMEKVYGTLTMPIELVHGSADTTVPPDIHAQRFVNDAPNANLTMLPGQGHMPQHSVPDEIIAAIDRAAARAGLR
ncbi:alpha/beta fold hydrolase [Sulfitobacter sp. JB4-11]|uniref:alpha/beta fold hydrolase n=1 Tax=Sulfitobacter rhodophyticola TaxID=3238304 RepID=UPI003513D949